MKLTFFLLIVAFLAGFIAARSEADDKARAAKAVSSEKKTSESSQLKTSLTEIAHVFKFYDCDKQFPADTSDTLNMLCEWAKKNPHQPQRKQLATGEGSHAAQALVQCIFSDDIYKISAEAAASTPEFEIGEDGKVSRITAGDLFVSGKTCEKVFSKNRKKTLADGEEAELCFNYYTDSKADGFRSPPACNERHTAESEGSPGEGIPDQATASPSPAVVTPPAAVTSAPLEAVPQNSPVGDHTPAAIAPPVEEKITEPPTPVPAVPRNPSSVTPSEVAPPVEDEPEAAPSEGSTSGTGELPQYFYL